VHHLLKADDCALYLVDEKTREFYLAKDDSMPGMRRFPFTTGIVGVVASTGSTIRISRDAHRDPRFAADVDQRKDKTTHSILCCPIKAEGADDKTNIIGVISVRDEKDRGGFEQEEEKLLKVFCAQAAVGIMNARRFANIMEQSEYKGDHSAVDFLRKDKGFRLANEDIEPFMFKMEDITMKGAIGTGSYGEVFRATVKDGKGDPQLVAVKKLHVRNLKAEQVEAFCNEAALMCQLDHPNVVGFIGAVTEPQNLCIITQYCAKGSLADLLLEESIEMDFTLKMKFAKVTTPYLVLLCYGVINLFFAMYRMLLVVCCIYTALTR
jgi:putative methionine-R-sulfoxide reductase with GAF domain